MAERAELKSLLLHVPKGDNKVAIALAVMAAMREYRKDKPIAFEWPKRWSDPTYLGDGPWGA